MSEGAKPVTDLSSRAVSLAREIDRLPPGRYSVEITKSALPASTWRIEILRLGQVTNTWIREMELPGPPPSPPPSPPPGAQKD